MLCVGCSIAHKLQYNVLNNAMEASEPCKSLSHAAVIVLRNEGDPKCERSTHIQTDSLFFLGVTTIGTHHSVTSVTGVVAGGHELIVEGEWDETWCGDTEKFGIFGQQDVKLLIIHIADVTIKYCGKLFAEVHGG